MGEPAHPKVFVVVPVFERLPHTRSCVAQLQAQTYPDLEIVIVDGGSRDGSLDELRRMEGITLIADVGEQWWTGATWLGIDHALRHGAHDDLVLLLNDDTHFDPAMTAVLVDEAVSRDAAVSPVIVDADCPERILNAGIRIDWRTYRFAVRTEPVALNTDVDTLEGRCAIVPVRKIRASGNVNPSAFPHYAGDFEFFCRLRRDGTLLAVTGGTRISSFRSATGILPAEDSLNAATMWHELTSRRSTTNLRDQLQLIRFAAPRGLRLRAATHCVARLLGQFALRTSTGKRLWARVKTVRSRISAPRS